MIIGHLPAGYVLSKLLTDKLARAGINPRYVSVACIIGAIAPDFDMLYFHLVDNRQHHHHTYWSHYPIVWLALLVTALVWYRFASVNSKARLAVVFSLTGFMHLLLDSIVGDIWWIAPFFDQPYAIFTVPALYKPWWLNFILHWSFALELLLLGWAIVLWRRTRSLPFKGVERDCF
jgi:inner membrane protein